MKYLFMGLIVFSCSLFADEGFTSYKAKVALTVYEKDLAKVKVKYVKSLKSALKSAMSKGELDEAKRIDLAIKTLEEKKVRVALGKPKNKNKYGIVKARFGVTGRWVDATDVLIMTLKGGTSSYSDGHFCTKLGDPAPGILKVLEITYIKSRKSKTVTIQDGSKIILE